MIKVGIMGVGGYAGQALLSLLLNHPEVKIEWIMSGEENEGKKIADRYPHLKNICDLASHPYDSLDNLLKKIDVVFLALPHGLSMNYVPKIIKLGKKAIDLGADYRFDDEEFFKKWYKLEHKDKKVLKETVFGLPELYRGKIKKAKLIGNPGCYPTAAILALAPLMKKKIIDFSFIVVDAKSGVSGAGRGLSLKTHFCERNEGVSAYSVNNHRHMGEINYQLGRMINKEINTTFVPHLIPMNRGILNTIYAKISAMKNQDAKDDLLGLYKSFYNGSPFVRIYEEGEPCTKNVFGTNYCDIGLSINYDTQTVIIMSAIDNLIKGAAGQAVQNMNLMFGLDETRGLKMAAIYP
ncbi:N-acetyl-gamma-glutamyl-phosphate reductase [candidate division WOR-1 bacterium RIFOXYA2_FULL_36_21]|uniref:N-acetyl-gamma-glutamyl-phosphate reductase n=1 Tax=candidate division WOR-1 bacterium RIFOXYB2_FULL_36_35 TaxID=1802578 RepID=A0A1F4S0W6_UNCSA|nr:MAG: N-acetyl-gamma-glutamyl-phosphate reductase [candidate division WOR-1 bacterium RIFOXYA2_FULL_36_21]OGC14029.1 MAG: N-acetyl-gamma-glutamyl-phosphate reductase [candidate division WOR-1 bacterium RIFOXYB2_FULL_36_35]OGC14964.1 MAG: N-acetyl-gamma-glutamyl-phosphate reductase [candidate division WOR-1 bacterium RIFOXYA12_FULL_36_13]